MECAASRPKRESGSSSGGQGSKARSLPPSEGNTLARFQLQEPVTAAGPRALTGTNPPPAACIFSRPPAGRLPLALLAWST